MIHRVLTATPYEPSALHSLGNAANMLIRQSEFPDTYDDELDIYGGGVDHDRLLNHNFSRTMNCFKKHTEKGDASFGYWVRSAWPKTVIACLQHLLQKEEQIVLPWTGFRVLGTIHRSNGHSIWTLELFAKHPESKTSVFSDENAPNVKRDEAKNRLRQRGKYYLG